MSIDLSHAQLCELALIKCIQCTVNGIRYGYHLPVTSHQCVYMRIYSFQIFKAFEESDGAERPDYQREGELEFEHHILYIEHMHKLQIVNCKWFNSHWHDKIQKDAIYKSSCQLLTEMLCESSFSIFLHFVNNWN